MEEDQTQQRFTNDPDNSLQINLIDLKEFNKNQYEQGSFHIGNKYVDDTKKHQGIGQHHHHLTEADKKMIQDTYEGLDFDAIENDKYKQRQYNITKSQQLYIDAQRWFLFGLVGIFTGLVGFGTSMLTEQLSKWRWENAQDYYKEEKGKSFAILAGLGILYVLISTLMVNYVSNEAGGSGIAQVKAFLNGVFMRKIYGLKVLIVKATGISLAISAGMPCGGEGPMVHNGSIIGYNVPRLASFGKKKSDLQQLKQDKEIRDFITAGAACGISAAFGSPIGGLLFAFEEASSFFPVPTMLKVMFASALATLTLFVMKHIVEGSSILEAEYIAQFRQITESSQYTFLEIPLFILIGIIGGLLGAFFNWFNVQVSKLRKRIIKKNKVRKIIEVLFLVLLFNTICFTFPMWFDQHCLKKQEKVPTNTVQNSCPEGYYDEVVTLSVNSMENVIINLYHDQDVYRPWVLLLYSLIFTLMCGLNFGSAIPSGLFVPQIMIGGLFGRFIGNICKQAFNIEFVGVYAFLGSGAMISGSMRIALSLTIILVETTRNADFLLPILIVCFTGKYVGDIFGVAIVDITIEGNHMPFVETHPPVGYEQIMAKEVMATDLKYFNVVDNAYHIYKTLQETTHNAFPVLNTGKQLVGLIQRKQLLVILQQKLFHSVQELQQGQFKEDNFNEEAYYKMLSMKQSQVYNFDFKLSPQEIEDLKNQYIELKSYLNPYPINCYEYTPLTRVYMMYRSLGLRHMPVINDSNVCVGMITRKELMTAVFTQDLY